MLKIFGFDSVNALLESTFKLHLFVDISKIAAVMGGALMFIEYNIGLPKGVILSFIILNVVEWVTGISAAIALGVAIQSKKMPRIVLKTAIYLVIIGCINQFRRFEGSGDLWSLFDWSYWFIVSVLSLTLIRSIFENLHLMGFKEVSVLYRLLDNKYTKVLSVLFSPPSDEKTNRK